MDWKKNLGEIQAVCNIIVEDGIDSCYEVSLDSVLHCISCWHTEAFRDSEYDYDRNTYHLYELSDDEVESALIELGYIKSKESSLVFNKTKIKGHERLKHLAINTYCEYAKSNGKHCGDFIKAIRIVIFDKIDRTPSYDNFNKLTDIIIRECHKLEANTKNVPEEYVVELDDGSSDEEYDLLTYVINLDDELLFNYVENNIFS